MDTNYPDQEDDGFDIEQYSRETEEKRKQKEFADFFLLEEIAGTLKGVPQSSRIPAEIIRDGGGTIEVLGDRELEDHEHEPQIIVHRTAEGEISSVEIQCTCGKKIRLQLQYQNQGTEEQSE